MSSRDLIAKVKRATQPPVGNTQHLTGVVDAVHDGNVDPPFPATVDVVIQGTTVTGIHYLDTGYAPTPGDVVELLQIGSSGFFCLGRCTP